MKVAVFPGSFDPLTLGHLDLIKRGSLLFDRLAVAVMINTSKEPIFTVDERVSQIKDAVKDMGNVSVITADELTVNLMNKIGADYLLRGLRNFNDFQYERDIAAMNQHLDGEIETIFMMANPNYQHLSSSLLKEVARFGGNISDYLPGNINDQLAEKLRGN
ncbi:pantetheine-phosphate adenylyltransferase [Paucilactobacillus suebicus]|uniref:Phosphopantetheine adenylyltransferase n=1 Tax=Paucilactobacillus suebicus DSM 5007 = KCTC 3549 TaxID=1423807 RepID=A0A0R1WCA0_9LACO|nr:pantetheine-phosphate adenylyltransferase [Paucilactobacillus suebicus]KRM12515.1 phosphopantetheine adenylyltransferase [Paucilactobacillus suebicus DSM 5007 = KCTC 3549]